jgi:cytochrome c-type biogenesis protein CcmH/NrfF
MAQTAEQQARIGRLERAVLAPCCYAEPVAIHQSEIALKMRLEIAKWVTAGKSDQEILGAYVQEYGAKVLVDPRTSPAWWAPWIPWLTLVFGVALVFWILKRWRSNRLPPAPPPGFEDRPLPDIEDEDAPGIAG